MKVNNIIKSQLSKLPELTEENIDSFMCEFMQHIIKKRITI